MGVHTTPTAERATLSMAVGTQNTFTEVEVEVIFDTRSGMGVKMGGDLSETLTKKMQVDVNAVHKIKETALQVTTEGLLPGKLRGKLNPDGGIQSTAVVELSWDKCANGRYESGIELLVPVNSSVVLSGQ